MGKVLTISPKLQWPWGVVFRVPDEHNGPKRGEWYYREDTYGRVKGPFRHHTQAQLSLDLERSIAQS